MYVNHTPPPSENLSLNDFILPKATKTVKTSSFSFKDAVICTLAFGAFSALLYVDKSVNVPCKDLVNVTLNQIDNGSWFMSSRALAHLNNNYECLSEIPLNEVTILLNRVGGYRKFKIPNQLNKLIRDNIDKSLNELTSSFNNISDPYLQEIAYNKLSSILSENGSENELLDLLKIIPPSFKDSCYLDLICLYVKEKQQGKLIELLKNNKDLQRTTITEIIRNSKLDNFQELWKELNMAELLYEKARVGIDYAQDTMIEFNPNSRHGSNELIYLKALNRLSITEQFLSIFNHYALGHPKALEGSSIKQHFLSRFNHALSFAAEVKEALENQTDCDAKNNFSNYVYEAVKKLKNHGNITEMESNQLIATFDNGTNFKN